MVYIDSTSNGDGEVTIGDCYFLPLEPFYAKKKEINRISIFNILYKLLFHIYLRLGGVLRLGGERLLGDGDLRRLYGDHRDLLNEGTRRGERDRERLRLSRLRDLDLERDRDREREAEDSDLLRFRPFLSRERFLSLPPERDLDLERELEFSRLK